MDIQIRNNDTAPGTIIEPIGELTAEVSRRVCEMAGNASRWGHPVIISLRETQHLSWAGLCHLANHVRGVPAGQDLRFIGVAPRTRSLLGEVGLGSSWIAD